MRTQGYAVVWDGTRARGPYLFVDREVPQPAPEIRERRTGLSDQVLDELRQRGEATMRELAVALELDLHTVNGALYALMQRRAIVVTDEIWHAGRRQAERVYAPTMRGGR